MEFVSSTEQGFSGESLWAGTEEEQMNSGDYYFDSYTHFSVHEGMLKDSIRTETYRKAIVRNSYLFEGKTVLDIGCGTGILSYFAAQAGAKHVYAVDNSDIIEYAKQIVAQNGFGDRITLIKGKIEEINLPVSSVDIIISEWMGFFLLYEGMLNSVLFARDKWLAHDGLLFPDKAKIWISALEDASYKDEKMEFWTDVYGIDMTPMRNISLKEPIVDIVESESIISTSVPIFEIDLQKVKADQLSFVSSFRLQFTKKDFMHAIVAWFETSFTHCHRSITLSTSPKNEPTHWKQTVFYLDHSLPVDVGQILDGSIAARFNIQNQRELDIKMSFNKEGNPPLHTFQFYHIR